MSPEFTKYQIHEKKIDGKKVIFIENCEDNPESIKRVGQIIQQQMAKGLLPQFSDLVAREVKEKIFFELSKPSKELDKFMEQLAGTQEQVDFPPAAKNKFEEEEKKRQDYFQKIYDIKDQALEDTLLYIIKNFPFAHEMRLRIERSHDAVVLQRIEGKKLDLTLIDVLEIQKRKFAGIKKNHALQKEQQELLRVQSSMLLDARELQKFSDKYVKGFFGTNKKHQAMVTEIQRGIKNFIECDLTRTENGREKLTALKASLDKLLRQLEQHKSPSARTLVLMDLVKKLQANISKSDVAPYVRIAAEKKQGYYKTLEQQIAMQLVKYKDFKKIYDKGRVRENPLKFLTKRNSREEMGNKIQNAIRIFVNKPSPKTLKILKTTLQNVNDAIQQEKQQRRYKLGKSTLESLIEKIYADIGSPEKKSLKVKNDVMEELKSKVMTR